MKDKAPTFADRLYMATHDPAFLCKDALGLRHKLFQARRFVLDQKMSSFLEDIATATFLRKGKDIILVRDWRPGREKVEGEMLPGSRNSNKLIEQIRLSARLPHPLTWIEYNYAATMLRHGELCGHIINHKLFPQLRIAEGWLLEQHPTIETAFKAHIFHHITRTPEGETDEVNLFPWIYCWTVDDQFVPWSEKEILPYELQRHPIMRDGHRVEGLSEEGMVSETICGLQHYRSRCVAAGYSPYFRLPPGTDIPAASIQTLEMLTQWSGVVRRIWSFLATINDIPVLAREVKTSKGFVARGSYKRFLDHKTITLHVPIAKDLRVLARHVVACARRRAHMVRGHWRKDWRHPQNPLCKHEWRVDQICKLCDGHRLWVHEYQRGDATLGVVMTDYEVVHDKMAGASK